MRQLVLIAHNVRSTHNVGSLLRTADGLGVETVWFTGYTPYPRLDNDPRLPYLAEKLARQIHKTSLGAEQTVRWQQSDDIQQVIALLKSEHYTVAALEQAPGAVLLPEYHPPAKLALIIGHEVEGLETAILKQVDEVLEIPMFGQKESFNVVQAAAMALYHCRFR